MLVISSRCFHSTAYLREKKRKGRGEIAALKFLEDNILKGLKYHFFLQSINVQVKRTKLTWNLLATKVSFTYFMQPVCPVIINKAEDGTLTRRIFGDLLVNSARL